ncbi:mechanosensitive ion channel family protein [Peribacillus saganii]|uniref:Mechanosensitive ion channel family protein n=1 Tax=Peribacillus saganii TaxID=2303992 RepID=A0A372LJ43_9BACI|nr:mechanosensitive ion channel family protein [Peribacillus saganii]RFU66427.1 mechanosensitive ion channel family protein [Peribacillus saganii]
MNQAIESISELINAKIWIDIVISLGVLFLFLAIRKIFTTYVFKIILRYAQTRNTETLAQVLLAFEKPFRWLIAFLGIMLAIKYFPFELIAESTATKIIRTVFIILATWGLINISAIWSILFPRVIKRFDLEVDQIVLPFFTKLMKVILFTLCVSIIAEEWGFNVNGFVAGLGLGGLAFALAAKDTVSNFFGGLVIITEKPFTIGDWIKTPSVEGTVEDISFRSTSVRTFAQALVTVPNATLSNESITNWSKMGKRQVAFHLGLTYDTPRKKLETVVRRIELMLSENEEVDNDTILARFDRFNDSSLDVYLYFFTKATSFKDYLDIKEDVNFKIMDILEQEGVSIAFPTRTLVVQSASANVEEELLKQTRQQG